MSDPRDRNPAALVYEKDLGETVIEFGDKIVRATARQINNDVFIAGNVATPYGVVEIASKVPVPVYNRMMEAAYNKLGAYRYAQLLGKVPRKLPMMLGTGSATAAGHGGDDGRGRR